MTTEQYIQIITAIVTIASVITAVTPSQTDNKVLDVIVKVLNALALNVYKNRNADLDILVGEFDMEDENAPGPAAGYENGRGEQ